jgi:hypothetical protein
MFTDAVNGAKKTIARSDVAGKRGWVAVLDAGGAGQQGDEAARRRFAYRDALKTIETIRAGSLRADESRRLF